jgi:hypothetical protein
MASMTSPFSLRQVLTTAAISTAVTSLAAAVLSRKETAHVSAGLNATSHIVSGKSAFEADDTDARHTLVGWLLNAGAMLAWSGVYELLPAPHGRGGALVKGAIVSALAYVTDYHVVPSRFTPGFEQRLSPAALSLIYASFAAALSASDLSGRAQGR